jgi:hypothetical protein
MVKLTEDEVRKLLARFVGINKPTLLGVVKSVNKTDNTCVVEDDGVDIPGIRLGSVTGAQGIVLYPKQKAFILCVKVEDTDEYSMLSASEYESIEITIDSLIINGGEFGGLVKVSPIVSWMQNVKTDLTTISTAMQGLGVPIVLTTTQPIQSDFENSKIKH